MIPCSRRETPASIFLAKPGLRSSSSNTVCFATCSSSESASVCAITMYGRSMNISASPKDIPGPMISTTFSLPCGVTNDSFTCP